MKTYSEDKIRDAFIATFRGIGSAYFPSSLFVEVSLDDELDAVEDYFDDFIRLLENEE